MLMVYNMHVLRRQESTNILARVCGVVMNQMDSLLGLFLLHNPNTPLHEHFLLYNPDSHLLGRFLL